MSTPKGHKDLWKEVDWSDRERKLAFFNKHFLNDDIVIKHVQKKINHFKQDIIRFVERGEIREGDKVRPITNEDILKELKGE